MSARGEPGAPGYAHSCARVRRVCTGYARDTRAACTPRGPARPGRVCTGAWAIGRTTQRHPAPKRAVGVLTAPRSAHHRGRATPPPAHCTSCAPGSSERATRSYAPAAGVLPPPPASTYWPEGRYPAVREHEPPVRALPRSPQVRHCPQAGRPAPGGRRPGRGPLTGLSLDSAAFPFGQAAPDAESFVVFECVLKALGPHLTGAANLLGLPG